MSPRPPSIDYGQSQGRTKEENQERRKDRSLDARIESANRASMLHKKRTGRALLINREVVENESMYEEIDDTYRAKMLQYMRVHNAQLNHDFDNTLLAGLPTTSQGLQMPSSLHTGPSYSLGQSSHSILQMPSASHSPLPSPSHSSHGSTSQSPQIPSASQNPRVQNRPISSRRNSHQRASSVAPTGPIHGARKLTIDLSQLRNNLPGPSTEPRRASSNGFPTPGANFSPTYLSPGQAHSQAQVPSYLAAEPSSAIRPQLQQQQQRQQQQQQQQQQQLLQTWQSLFPRHSISDSTSLGGLPAIGEVPGQYRDRIASAPTFPIQDPVHIQAQAQTRAQAAATAAPLQNATPAPGPVAAHGTSQHHRVRSEPGPAPIAVSTTIPSSSSSVSLHTGFYPTSASSLSDPSSSAELLPTPRSMSPHTPAPSQASHPRMSFGAGIGELNMNEAEPFKHTLFELQGFDPDLQLGLEMSGQGPESADQDFLDFSQFASTLDQNHHQAMFPSHWQMPVGSGDMPADSGFSGGLDMKEYITNFLYVKL
ncbi:hypothetical protein AN5709.2 [Aspergillus nidulans FGSC A4]|uniref:Uncharacterized protein n=1 Tax=Emericella nidulans (strain FGSC A4 / ATCC 38163 / CBS 112.46 / NRRL 194 / M139) TaxID=227321 RepID=Q5B171_EMENI|nr:hypothetical protein [Aspergillus nidulans FGSC A4]EAA62802.1 hypothetical protein AN5709.2 [Aspergillus nidulans FGSC A4]CBF81358.1 TPA: conserved hypothetical protein [Aspergillus nidulans FGSC A4]|eukprot:XP_663313.1 hypothetical protein AN5709.2 [Aspergillus nidulans FGSC A4]